ncbi:fasciclin-like arabinogalactan protein 6 [Mercurialis annua]|uniref:fasciclin-like arabinogalactan protein 6 n=1 Tax=Mercurialis annua TaxID=3986 RepID=UPI00215F22C5|nr:fasciclin-like arabinogalactan protein 6 [Mercurialis annua]
MAASTSPLHLTIFLFFFFSMKIQSHLHQLDSNPLNLTETLTKNGEFIIFINLLATTPVPSQIQKQLTISPLGLTVFAPSDPAFSDLEPDTILNLTAQRLNELVRYHILPRFYNLNDLFSVKNPIRTQASGQEGGAFSLNFTVTDDGERVKALTGVVGAEIKKVLRQEFPLAVYGIDEVLLPAELFGEEPLIMEAPAQRLPEEILLELVEHGADYLTAANIGCKNN